LAFPTWSGTLWGRRLQEAPSLVAETLERVRDPLPAWLRPGPPAPPVAIAARLARSLLPPQASDQPPAWLRPDQRLSFARALAAVRRYGGALLADRPGTGKTWIGLAVAARLEPSHPIHVVAPATLRTQWNNSARRAGLPIQWHSHEMLSRGVPPPPTPGAMIVDESHRLRNPATRRYLTLAPWCIGRKGLLLSATPIVNRFADIVHQLRLLIRDDALAWSGLPDLTKSGEPELSGELARVIVTGEDRSGALPDCLPSMVRIDDPSQWFRSMLTGVMALRLSGDSAIAGLIRASLLGALGSSPLAIAEALGRYRALLLHIRDASSSGRVLSRQTIRQFAGTELDQLVFWPLVAEPTEGVELMLDDLERVRDLEATAKQQVPVADLKARALLSLMADSKRTLVFTNARATVRYMKRHLGSGIAWCTGERSGIDALELPRDDVLDLFRAPESPSERVRRPRVLLATDVAAEGLDLPLVARVVHYDLPWTAVRLEQRTGRAFRLGSFNPAVEVVSLLPPRELESLLRREEILARKGILPEQLGLNEAADAPWRLRARIAVSWMGESPGPGIAQVNGEAAGFIGSVRIGLSNRHSEELILARLGGEWLRDVAAIAGLLDRVRSSGGPADPNPRQVAWAVAAIAKVVRRRLRTLRTDAIAPPPRVAGFAALRRNLIRLGGEASGRRDFPTLTLAQRGLRWLRRGHTAGEHLCIQQWARLAPNRLRDHCAKLPDMGLLPRVLRVELPALLIISPERAPG
jgi:superfamily II DNA or RNA helicase